MTALRTHSGQASVEAVAILPFGVLAALVAWQLVLAVTFGASYAVVTLMR